MKAAIVILNFNGEKHLESFLPSVVKHCPNWAEVIIADNGSSDNSLLFLEKNYPQLKTLIFDKNYGFAGGYNKALALVEAKYFVLLNSDVEVTDNWLEPIVKEMDANKNIAASQPKIKAFNNRHYFEYAGAAGGFIDKYGYPFCRGRIFDNCERDIGQHDDIREVFWATGACLIVRSDAYWRVEGLDADFFAHMEEIDLCWRLKNLDYQIYCFPQSRVFHLGGGTLAAQNAHKTYLNFRNNLTLIIKNDYRKGFLKILFSRMVLDGVAATSMIFSRGPSHFFAVIKAHLYFYTHLGVMRRKRKYWRDKKTKSNLTGYYRQSIVKDHFIGNKKVFRALPNRYFIRQDRSN